jgi:hypothetical protein
MPDRKILGKLKGKAVSAVKSADGESRRIYPQPSARPVFNNRVVFGAGLLTGLVIGLWVGMFLCMFLPMVM